MDGAGLSLNVHGACYCPGLALASLREFEALADRLPQNSAGTRIFGDPEAASLLSPDGPIGQTLLDLTGRRMRPVRAILFDKSDAINWALTWHQDRTIAVKDRCDLPGYGPWTRKQGFQHVQPPFDLTRRMVTVRIHLDDVDESNGPLLVALGSHLRGFVPVDAVERVVAEREQFSCLACAGDVWVYSTPILHSSDRVTVLKRRRVLQADFSSDILPDELEWLGI